MEFTTTQPESNSEVTPLKSLDGVLILMELPIGPALTHGVTLGEKMVSSKLNKEIATLTNQCSLAHHNSEFPIILNNDTC